ncbi:anti-sigma factor domain-containing protein [Arthrobacter sp. ISL-69]|uniref:anti-sigma factor domain-containing protein n=1 Tax=Arthrobacter sp. ISL-69 TaxID=2819113 RepID=UPI001BEA8DD2|nr:anti-sigma factor [Arthrobacter sp. ISL-69]MBT2538553.1 anti-sigma factor [Arthrobacter sp. ISL-69]
MGAPIAASMADRWAARHNVVPQVSLPLEGAIGQVSGFREVWVISPDLSKLVSLGVLDGEPGVFAIPEGLDLAEYPIVDVSNEPFDGNPGHSSDSIARGELAAEN